MKNNCMICGEELVYTSSEEEMECALCGKKFMSNAKCQKGHFVCDGCHQKDGRSEIKRICMTTDSKNPIAIITEIMENPLIHIHGPEHHSMVGAALFTAYKNSVIANSGKKDQAFEKGFEKNLEEVLNRGQKVPGGTCGFWGVCGASISCGIFFSLITRATPLSKNYWALIQKGAAKSLEQTAQYGGPRCCKRSSWLSILAAIDFTNENFGIKMEGSGKDIICEFSAQNKECLGSQCPFHKNSTVKNL